MFLHFLFLGSEGGCHGTVASPLRTLVVVILLTYCPIHQFVLLLTDRGFVIEKYFFRCTYMIDFFVPNHIRNMLCISHQ